MHLTTRALSAALLAMVSAPATAQADQPIIVPENTLVVVTPTEEITSKGMREGEVKTLMVVNDIVQDGTVVIPRGSPVKATVTWRTGKGIVGKSAKYELTFNSVRAANRNWALRGKHRQEGRGNTVGALLGSMIITGRSAVATPGMLINVFTAEDIVFQPRVAANVDGPAQATPVSVQPAKGLKPNSVVQCITC